jgi:hypothetical protein
VELLGGPHDGATEHYTRRPGEVMPDELADHPGYRLRGVNPITEPRTYRYGWQHPPAGQRKPCRQPACAGAGCPNKRR